MVVCITGSTSICWTPQPKAVLFLMQSSFQGASNCIVWCKYNFHNILFIFWLSSLLLVQSAVPSDSGAKSWNIGIRNEESYFLEKRSTQLGGCIFSFLLDSSHWLVILLCISITEYLTGHLLFEWQGMDVLDLHSHEWLAEYDGYVRLLFMCWSSLLSQYYCDFQVSWTVLLTYSVMITVWFKKLEALCILVNYL